VPTDGSSRTYGDCSERELTRRLVVHGLRSFVRASYRKPLRCEFTDKQRRHSTDPGHRALTSVRITRLAAIRAVPVVAMLLSSSAAVWVRGRRWRLCGGTRGSDIQP